MKAQVATRVRTREKPLLDLTKDGKGRPTKLNPEIEATIIKAVMEGTPLNHAARSAGIDYTSMNRWANLGKEDMALGRTETALARFYVALRQAESRAVQKMAQTVTKAAEDQWQAAAWYLERRAPDDFGRKDKIEHSGRIERVGITINVDAMREEIPDASLAKILEKVLLRPAPALTDAPDVIEAEVVS